MELERAIEEYSGLVRRIISNVLGDRAEDIEEVMSDVFVAWWRLSEAPDSPKSYICAVARHKAIDRLRSLTAAHANVSIDGMSEEGATSEFDTALSYEEDIAAALDLAADADELADAIARLGEYDRSVILLRYWYFEKIDDIAVRLGTSPKAIESALYRLRKRLRETRRELCTS